MSKGVIIILSGYSGTGKNAIISEIRKLLKDEISYIPSYTTRAIREYDNEKQGSPYFFVSQDEFLDKIKNNDFIEYNKIHGNLYGTPIQEYKDALSNDEIIVKDIDVEGALRMKGIFGSKALLVFVEPPSVEELKNRLMSRGDSNEQIDLRLQRIEFESSFKKHFDKEILNDTLDYAVQDLLNIINEQTEVLQKELPIKELIPTQPIKGMQEEYIKGLIQTKHLWEKENPIVVYESSDHYYIVDGHHRALAKYWSGDETIECQELHKNSRNYNITLIGESINTSDTYDWEDALKNGRLKYNK